MDQGRSGLSVSGVRYKSGSVRIVGYLFLSCQGSSASITQAVVLYAAFENAGKPRDMDIVNGRLAHRGVYVGNAAAANTAHMLMGLHVGVKAIGVAGYFQLGDLAALCQEEQIAVDSAKTDPGQSLTDNLVELVRSGMGLELAQLLENNSALLRHARLWLMVEFCHVILPL